MASSPALGFRRVLKVTIDATAVPATAEVSGVVHRYERTVRVPMALAARLVLAGVPLVVKGLSEPAEPGRATT